MAHKISDECIACGACADTCPVGAISENGGKYEINPTNASIVALVQKAAPSEQSKADKHKKKELPRIFPGFLFGKNTAESEKSAVF